MPFIDLSGKGVRNLREYQIKPSSSVNIVVGKNGAGKTNILEAIYLNALGRSFRTSAVRSLISDKEKACWVFSHYEKLDSNNSKKQAFSKIGVERSRVNQQKLSINGEHHKSLAKLAALVPILAIQPSETALIDGPSSTRRKHLDWLMFHVEPQFLEFWRDNQRLLKQRNLLLRRFSKQKSLSQGDYAELGAWDSRFVKTNQQVDALRKPLSKTLETTTNEYLGRLPAFIHENKTSISIGYSKGWPEDGLFLEALESGLERDIKRGFTQLGVHRCDLVLRANGNTAKDYLSRGQKKLLAMTMRLAQAKELFQRTGQRAVLLLDDLFAELDEENLKAFIVLVEELDTQVFLTCLNTEAWVKDIFSTEVKVFHVEHGEISTI